MTVNGDGKRLPGAAKPRAAPITLVLNQSARLDFTNRSTQTLSNATRGMRNRYTFRNSMLYKQTKPRGQEENKKKRSIFFDAREQKTRGCQCFLWNYIVESRLSMENESARSARLHSRAVRGRWSSLLSPRLTLIADTCRPHAAKLTFTMLREVEWPELTTATGREPTKNPAKPS